MAIAEAVETTRVRVKEVTEQVVDKVKPKVEQKPVDYTLTQEWVRDASSAYMALHLQGGMAAAVDGASIYTQKMRDAMQGMDSDISQKFLTIAKNWDSLKATANQLADQLDKQRARLCEVGYEVNYYNARIVMRDISDGYFHRMMRGKPAADDLDCVCKWLGDKGIIWPGRVWLEVIKDGHLQEIAAIMRGDRSTGNGNAAIQLFKREVGERAW